MTTPTNRPRRAIRFFAILQLVFLVLVSFVGGFSALLFEAFANSSTAKYSWLLLCGGLVLFVTLVVFVLFNLYMRFSALRDWGNEVINLAEQLESEKDQEIEELQNEIERQKDEIKDLEKELQEIQY